MKRNKGTEDPFDTKYMCLGLTHSDKREKVRGLDG